VRQYRIEPGAPVRLGDWDPDDTAGFDKLGVRGRLKALRKRLAAQQRVMWAEGRHRLLVVFQAMDTGGKDGTIRKVFSGVNPQGVRVVNFKAPSRIELAHDYLWRIHRHTPGDGEIVVFNRSHYEDVLVVRVLGLVPEERWERRYDHINAFERLLSDEGTTILKFYLHISKEEQAKRLRARLADPEKHWKFNVDDLATRERWDDYMAAFEAVLSTTSTADAPWHVVPANHKWYRNLVVAETIVATLEGLGMEYPEPEEDLDGIVVT
jgi:PPK2 family polyphosphate:nucleotide phosphotransferase